jgi:hypothetical protein
MLRKPTVSLSGGIGCRTRGDCSASESVACWAERRWEKITEYQLLTFGKGGKDLPRARPTILYHPIPYVVG